jgi:hypothetical protein
MKQKGSVSPSHTLRKHYHEKIKGPHNNVATYTHMSEKDTSVQGILFKNI